MNVIFILGLIAFADGASLSPPSNDLTPPLAPSAQLLASGSEDENLKSLYGSNEIEMRLESEDDKLKGLYVPDNIEKQFNDGSYKTEPTPLPLIDSPYGLVPVGSGLEGQYVPDNLEKLYDDGLYKADTISTNSTPLFDTPYGRVAAGSGLEGHYFPNNTEELFDDGSYRQDKSENF